MRPSPGSENVRPRSGVPTRIVTAAIMFTSPTAAAGASGRKRAAPANAGANGIPAATPMTAAAAMASGKGFAIASTATPAPETRKLARMMPGRSISRPPSGRDTSRGTARARRRGRRRAPGRRPRGGAASRPSCR